MEDYDEKTYGERIAQVYDELYSEFDPDSIKLLTEFAGGGPALELGIGSGRIALPLYESGIAVQGIDASEQMIRLLKSKPNGGEIEVIHSSFAQYKIEKRFRLIYVVFNTFFALLTQEEQLSCFQCAREHLSPGGSFLLEVFVPDMNRFVNHQTVRAVRLSEQAVQLDVSTHDPVSQQVTSQHIMMSEEGIRLYPVKLRYSWPSELDLMARFAGFTLRHRWGSWSRDEFTGDSPKHISVYGIEN